MTENPGALSVERTLCLALYSASNATVQLYRDLLAPWDLSYQQLLVLAVVGEEPGATPGRIAEALHLDASSVAGLLRRLEAAGMIERAVDPDDRRRVLVHATARATEIAAHQRWLEQCITEAIGLDEAAAQRLIELLSTLRASVTAYDRGAPQTALAGAQ